MTHERFDAPTLPLDHGTTVVEASAGTGKTHNIAALVVRALAEGHARADEVLLITYTRRATAELRTRVHRAIREAAAGEGAAPYSPEQLGRLQQAAAAYDQTTIMTTSAFCEHLISALGVHVDHDPSSTVTPDVRDLVDEVTDDVFLRGLLDGEQLPRPDKLRQAVKLVTDRSSVPILDASGTRAQTLRGRLLEARDDLDARMRARHLHTFQDTITRLRDALRDDPEAVHAITGRYRLVVVDEFQDTDALQWHVLSGAFGGPDQARLILIGDPKQSIYGFRNADVHAYLTAARQHAPLTLTHNWRSSHRLLEGIDAILNEASLGPGIATPRASGGPGQLDPSPWGHPVCLRLLTAGNDSRRVVAEEVAATVQDLHDLRPTVTLPGKDPRPRTLQLDDIAVLVRQSRTARSVHAALNRAGVPAVVLGTDNLLSGGAARDWAVVLETLLDLNTASMRRAALTSLVGWSLPRLVAAPDDEIDGLARDLRELSLLWRTQGLAVMADSLADRFGLHARLLSGESNMQLLSDLLQVAELAHAEQLRHQLSPEATLAWLRTGHGEASSRRGSDQRAVQIMTIHSAKGLGFPVVLLPDLWDPPVPEWIEDPTTPRLVHRDGQPWLDPQPSGPNPEDAEEALRLAYVAMTRARVGLKIWLPDHDLIGRSAIYRLLNHDAPGTMPPAGEPLRTMTRAQRAQFWEEFGARLRTERFASLTMDDSAPRLPRASGEEQTNMPSRRARAFTRAIDHDWRRTSYTGLTADLHHVAPGEVATAAPGLDEPEAEDEAEAPTALPRRTPSPLAGVRGGTAFGTLVHAILEHVNPQAPDLRDTIRRAATPWLRGAPDLDPDVLVDSLVGVFHTPLDPLTPRCLGDIGARDRLPELDFEMTMGSADGASRVRDLAALFSDRALLSAGDPLAGYGETLAHTPAAEQVLSGFLTGSIDAVLRLRDEERYLVVDYKTNRLPTAPGEELCLEHHTPSAMATAMKLSHYPLQALLYSVALHRWLSWRLPSYDPQQHLGGIGYLFVRGMAGPDTPVLDGMRAGVFSWSPGADFVLAAHEIVGGHR